MPRTTKKKTVAASVSESREEHSNADAEETTNFKSATKSSPKKSGRGRGRPKRSGEGTSTGKKKSARAEKSGTGDDKKKRKKSRFRHTINYAVPIHRILKQIYPGQTVSVKSMAILCSFADDAFTRMAVEAGKLSHISRKNTMTAREMQTAVRLLIPGELGKHAVAEGTKAVQLYITNTNSGTTTSPRRDKKH